MYCTYFSIMYLIYYYSVENLWRLEAKYILIHDSKNYTIQQTINWKIFHIHNSNCSESLPSIKLFNIVFRNFEFVEHINHMWIVVIGLYL